MRPGEVDYWSSQARVALSFGVASAMRQALFAQRRGQVEAAAAIYTAVLEREPDNWDALHCLGLAEFDRRHYARAVELVREAVRRHPEVEIAQKNLAHLEEFMRLWESEQHLPSPTRPPIELAQERLIGVSVVMPAYNHARFCTAALDSVFAQTLPPAEVIVVDDGSTDGTAELLACYGRELRLVIQDNQGAHAALNRGLGLARGDYIALMNSDDLWAPTRLSSLVSELEKQAAGLAFSLTRFIDDAGSELPADTPYIAHLLEGMNRAAHAGDPVPMLDHMNIAISSGNFLFRRDLLEKTGGFARYQICHDWDFLRAATRATKVILVPERLYAYRLHAGNSYDKHGLRGRWEMEQILKSPE